MSVWVNDTTPMPARMHLEYLRGVFMENRISAGRFAAEGRVIALRDIAVPLFVVATETDHIAPWQSVYKTALFTDCDLCSARSGDMGAPPPMGAADKHHEPLGPAPGLYVHQV